jgi:O-antigen ligase
MTLLLQRILFFSFFPMILLQPKGVPLLLAVLALTCIKPIVFNWRYFVALMALPVVGLLLAPFQDADTLISLKTASIAAAMGGVGAFVMGYMNEIEAYDGKDLFYTFIAGAFFTCLMTILFVVIDVDIVGVIRNSKTIIDIMDRPSTLIALSIWPIVGYMQTLLREPQRQRYISNYGLIIAFLFVIMGSLLVINIGCLAAKVALAVGAVTWLFARVFGHRLGWAVAALAAVFVLITPKIPERIMQTEDLPAMIQQVKTSAYHRLLIWDYLTKQIEKKPVIGHGFDSLRKNYKKDNSAGAWGDYVKSVNQNLDTSFYDEPLHPHNISLQVWYDTGLIGAIVLAILLAGSAILISQLALTRIMFASMLAFYSSAVTIAHISFGTWQSFWLGILFVSIILMILAHNFSRWLKKRL